MQQHIIITLTFVIHFLFQCGCCLRQGIMFQEQEEKLLPTPLSLLSINKGT